MKDLPLIRRARPELFGNKIQSVQPIDPIDTGKAFSMRYHYGDTYFEYEGKYYQLEDVQILEGPMTVYKVIDTNGKVCELSEIDKSKLKYINERLFKISMLSTEDDTK